MMLTHSLKSKQFWLSLFITLVMTAILCGMGVWQVQRLHWKTALIDSFHNPDKIMQAPSYDAWAINLANPEPVMFFGYYIPQGTVFIPEGDKTIVYMPFKTTNGVIVMMRRGTIATTETAGLILDNSDNDQKIISLVGVPLPRPQMIPFMTVPRPADLTWPFLDWAQIKAKYIEQPLAPYIVAVLEEPDSALLLTHTPPELRNEHKQYAIFWFAMAAIALVLFSRFLIFAPRGKEV